MLICCRAFGSAKSPICLNTLRANALHTCPHGNTLALSYAVPTISTTARPSTRFLAHRTSKMTRIRHYCCPKQLKTKVERRPKLVRATNNLYMGASQKRSNKQRSRLIFFLFFFYAFVSWNVALNLWSGRVSTETGHKTGKKEKKT